MSNMHRIQWFDQQIREACYPNSNVLAQQFEMSKRQAQRDIEYMMTSLRAPLVYMAKYRGYCYENKAYVLPNVFMTEEEKQVLQYLAFRYRSYNKDNAKAISRISHLLDRMTEEQQSDSSGRLPVFETDSRLMQNYQLLTYAIQQQYITNITYRDTGVEARLRIYPFKLVSLYATDYVVAYCEQKDMQRTFRLHDIWYVSVTNTKFEALAIMHDWIEGAVIKKKPFTAKVLLTKPISGHSWNGFPIRAVHDFVYEIEFYDIDSFLQHLLISEWEKLLSPKWLIAKLHGRCSDVLARCDRVVYEQSKVTGAVQ
jgi:predicted DNA-binding transcriptional regulator YafY